MNFLQNKQQYFQFSVLKLYALLWTLKPAGCEKINPRSVIFVLDFSETALVAKCIELWDHHETALSENWDKTGWNNIEFNVPKSTAKWKATSCQ